MMKRLSMGALALCLSACSLLAPKYERPTLTVVGVQMQGGNLMQQTFKIKLHVDNPNNRRLPVAAIHVAMRLFGEQVATGQSDQPFVVAALGATDFDMTVTANMALALLKLANKKDRQGDAIEYEVTGTATIDTPFVREVPFHQNGVFSLH